MGIRSFAADLLPSALLQTARERPAAAVPRAEANDFAALTDKLGYLSKAELKQVREAYKFADEAHLGQFRASGQAYITHPIAVAGLVADWKLDVQAIMAALMHDAMEDCGVTKPELIERFGAPTAELVDGLTKLDKLHFSTREESQAESFRKMLLAMARDVRVILVKLADRLHNMRTMSAVAADKRGRIARETLDIYAPIAHRLGLNQIYRELQELSFAQLYPWRHARAGQGADEGPRHAARHRRARAEGRREGLRRRQAEGAGLRPREDGVLDLPQDARQAPAVCQRQRPVRLSHRRAAALRLLCRAGRAAPALQADAGPLQGLHRDPQGQRLPVAAHHAGQPARHRGRVPDPHRADARRGREPASPRTGCTRPRAATARRRCAAPGRHGAEEPDRHPGRHARRRRIPRARQDRPLPRGGLRLHAEVADPVAAARRHAGRLRLRDPLRRRRPLRGGHRQRRGGGAAHRAEERRRGGDHHRARRAAEPGLAELRAHRPRALEDPPPPEDDGARGVARARRAAAGAEPARRGPADALVRPQRRSRRADLADS